MTQRASSIPSIRAIPWLAATALVPGVMVLQHWDPCDTTVAIASGSSLLHIGLCLATGVLTGLGVAIEPASIRSHRAPSDRWLRVALIAACALAIAWLAWGTSTVSGRGNSRFAVNGFWQWTSMLVWSTSVGLLATRPGFSRVAITGLLALGVGVLVYGYWEYMVIQPSLRRQLERNPAELFRREGIAAESSAALLLADRIRSTEMKGVYALANSLGGFLAGLWVLVFGLWMSRGIPSFASWISGVKFGFFASLLACIGAALLLTKSRTAWIAAGSGTLMATMIVAWVAGRISKRALGVGSIVACAVLALAVWVVYFFDPLIVQEAGKSLAYRFDYWQGAIALIASEPWRGFGVGGFQSTYLQVKLPTAAESPADPHNFLLETAHAGGVPLLLLVSAAIGLSSWIVVAGMRGQQTWEREAVTSKGIAIAFWSGAVLAVALQLLWSYVTASDERSLGTVIAFAVSAAIAALVSPWIGSSTSAQPLVQSSVVLWLVFVVQLVHGLASGGWLLPGTMGIGMIAIGLALGGGYRGEGVEQGWGWGRLGFAGAASLFAAVWYASMAFPISKAMEQEGAVFGGLVPNPSPKQLQALMEADRRDPELARLGVDWVADHLARPMGRESRAEWESVLGSLQKAFVERDPKHALAWESCGQASVRAAVAAGSPQSRDAWLREADRAFQIASDLHPASVSGHVQAALAASWAGDWDRSQKHCLESEKIDSATRHRDRKLAVASVLWPAPLVPADAQLGDDARRGVPPDCVKAEPVLRYLRSHGRQ